MWVLKFTTLGYMFYSELPSNITYDLRLPYCINTSYVQVISWDHNTLYSTHVPSSIHSWSICRSRSQVSLRFIRIHILRKFVICKSLLRPKVSHRQLHKSGRLVTDNYRQVTDYYLRVTDRSSTTTDKPQATV